MSQISTDIETHAVHAAPANHAPARPLFEALIARLRGFSLLRQIKRKLVQFGQGPEEAIYRSSEVAQKSLIAAWKQLQAAGVILPLDQVGFSRFSEFEEDGHLLYLLTLGGSASRTVVEISSQDGRTCMATNLLVHHRWRGFLFDGDPVFVAEGRRARGSRRTVARYRRQRPAPVERNDLAAADPDLRIQQCGAE